ncbi:acyl dehydratase [Mycobacterium mantenii]|uniref:Acyl dehydratase n=1 Tax=Mycobacterium mantenii TaxID=560555 RepID=A0A1A2T249_MYCNT|nr:acyl dehydratase [Mycobacterium mantenii]OBH70465.1 acyl dehydratase [Mycobacterium mantenii]
MQAGDARETRLVEGLSRTQIVQYAGASGDFNPLHHDEPFTREKLGMPGVFAHGMLTMGMTGRVLTDWFGAESIVEYGARFAAQVWPGDTLTATARIDAVRPEGAAGQQEMDITLTTHNQHGAIVLAGTAKVRPDSQE